MPWVPDLDGFSAIGTNDTGQARDHFQLNRGLLWELTDLFLEARPEWLAGMSLSSSPFEVGRYSDGSHRDFRG